MLSEQSAATVRATLPVVGAALGEITERFYAGMFAARPELLRDLFNRGNQAAGTQRQALAGSIAAFAAHLLDHPDDRPDAMLSRIAHKHASLGVTPDQYAIVHEHLFAAIAEVLGDAVTPEVAAAWDEVYWLMANALTAVEKRLYEERGGAAWRPWEVVERVAETADVVTFRLRPADGGPVRDFRPGQYVSVRVPLADGARQIRQYSLSGAPGAGLRQFSVKRVHDGTAPDGEVSSTSTRASASATSWSCRRRTGTWCWTPTTTPAAARVRRDRRDPARRDARAPRRFGAPRPGHRRARRPLPADHALRTDHEAYAAKLPDATVRFWYEQDAPAGAGTGYVDLTDVPVAPGTRAYLCGPLPFMRTVRRQLIAKGVAPADVHYEVFGPDLWLAR